MRSIWKGSLAFGLVNVPVKLYSATEDHDVRFHQVHAEDGGRVQYKRVCSVCGKQVEYAEIAKAYDAPSGERVVMSAEDFDGLPAGSSREIDVVEFVPSDQVDPVLFDRSYYLEPEERAAKAYVLLREALRRTDRTAITKVALRQKTRLAALRVHGDVLLLQTMLWQDEVRSADFDVLADVPEVRAKELEMADTIIENLSADFTPEDFRDEYREQLLEHIEAKLAGGEGIVRPESADDGADGGGTVLDLMAALKASVANTSGDRTVASETTSASPEPSPTSPPAEKPATKKATKKSATKKAPAKKAAAKKATKKPAAKSAAKKATGTSGRKSA